MVEGLRERLRGMRGAGSSDSICFLDANAAKQEREKVHQRSAHRWLLASGTWVSSVRIGVARVSDK